MFARKFWIRRWLKSLVARPVVRRTARPPLVLERLEDRIVPTDVFLQGKYVEVGINDAGSFGTSTAAPAGFHPRPEFRQTSGSLGFVADPAKDNWATEAGDYFVPGTPEEGWAVKWGTSTLFTNAGLVGKHDVPTTSLTNTSSGGVQSAVWVGTATSGSDKLQITQTVHFGTNDLFFVISTTLTNVGTTTLQNVRYSRNVDPDNEEPQTGIYTTSNYIADQPPHPGVTSTFPSGNTNAALVVAKGLNFGVTLGLGTIDSRATVSTGGFENHDPDPIINQSLMPSVFPTESNPRVADEAISLGYSLGNLAPGQSTTMDYAYILSASDLTTALGQLGAVTILQPTGTVSGTNVLFQATTNDVAHTAKVDFFANGNLVGTSTTPDAGGVFQTSFDSTPFANGSLTLQAVATFLDGQTDTKTTTVTVSNSGPPIALTAPTPGQVFSGSGIPITVSTLDPSHLPTRVDFFRESLSGGSVFLGEDTSAPFTSSFSVTDLPLGETVTIKAVATDSLGRSTTVQVSGTVRTNHPPVANPDSISTQVGETATVASSTLLANDTDADGDPLTLTAVFPSSASGGSVSLDPSTHLVTYIPPALFSGTDEFTYFVSDGIASAQGTVTVFVTKRDQSISFNPLVDKTYGDPDFELTATASSGLPVSYSATGDATVSQDTSGNWFAHITGAGTATITASQAGDSTYSAAPDVSQTLTIDRAALTVTANSSSKTYGQTVTFAGTEFTTGGLVNGDAVTSVTLSSDGAAATAQVSGSPYSIAVSAAVGTGLGNYNISYVNGALTVNPASLTVTANDRSKTYGETATFAGTEFTTGGLVNGDTVASVSLSSDGAAATAQVSGSPYTISASAAVGTGLGNYNISYVNGALTVNPLTVTLSGSRTYDGTTTAPASILTVTDLIGSDNLTLSGSATLAGADVGTEAVSSVSGLSLGGSSASNYTLTGATGSVTITKATTALSNMTVSQIAVGSSATTLSGLLNSNTIVPAGQSVAITLNGVTQSALVGANGSFSASFATGGLGAGTYTISYDYAGDHNFTASSGSGSLTVAYGTKLLFDNSRAVQSGSALPIKVEATDANGANVSSATLPVKAMMIVGADGHEYVPVSKGNANPNELFRYDPTLGGYIFNLDTTGLTTGTYTFYFTIGNDPTLHSLTFSVR